MKVKKIGVSDLRCDGGVMFVWMSEQNYHGNF